MRNINQKRKILRKLSIIIKSLDTFVSITKASISVILSVRGVGLIVTPISTGTACAMPISN